jgi:hypothetical protein
MIEINEGVGWPQFGMQFFARYHFAGTLDQHRQNSKGLTR